MIQITCKGNSAICTRTERLTSGMVGLQCKFEFDGAWDGLARTAVFLAGNEKRDVLLTGDTCTVPWEVLKTAGYQLVIGVYGTNAEGTLVIPTCYAMCGGIASGADPSGDESTDPTLPVWGQIQGMIGNLDDLATASKDNLVAAINEAAQSGGGSAIELDTTLTQSGKAADAKAVGDEIRSLSEEIANGLSETAKDLLITILRNGVFSSDQSANITALENALASGGSGEIVTYTITNILTNVTTDNYTASVTENSAFGATLTASEGYELDSVAVTMGGVDITASVYADGVVSIASVTGNIVITATAVLAGKMYFNNMVQGGINNDGLSVNAREDRVSDITSRPVLTAGLRYKLVGVTGVLYGLREIYNEGATNIAAGNSINGKYKDHGWQNTGYIFTALEDVAYVWVTAAFDSGSITPEQATPVYLEAVN